jgi:hypothetical protein
MRADVTDWLLTAVHFVFGAVSSGLRHVSADAATMSPPLFFHAVILGLMLLVIAYVALRTTGLLVVEVAERIVRSVCLILLRSGQAMRPSAALLAAAAVAANVVNLGHYAVRALPPTNVADLDWIARWALIACLVFVGAQAARIVMHYIDEQVRLSDSSSSGVTITVIGDGA